MGAEKDCAAATPASSTVVRTSCNAAFIVHLTQAIT
jgi:hypothetical protein